jgi:hypothetical protein
MRRKQRDWAEIISDPKAPYMIGRLLGANEMAVALLNQEGESENARKVAEVLSAISVFFMEAAPE